MNDDNKKFTKNLKNYLFNHRKKTNCSLLEIIGSFMKKIFLDR